MTKEEIKNLMDQYKYVESRVCDINRDTEAIKKVERMGISPYYETTKDLLERVNLFSDIDSYSFFPFIQKKMMEFAESFIAEKENELKEYNASEREESHKEWVLRKWGEQLDYMIDSVKSGASLSVKIGEIERYEVWNFPVDRKELLAYLQHERECFEGNYNLTHR